MNTEIYETILSSDTVPEFARVSFDIERSRMDDLSAEIDRTLEQRGVLQRIRPGDRIALTASSREITNLKWILRRLCERVKQHGGHPFIVPAMGSHGGATAIGQKKILEGYGITEEMIGAPIYASMQTAQIGVSASGLPVFIDQYAAQADGIIVVGRVKPHTDFHGKVESGLMKMMAIGLGKQHGASICHKRGFGQMGKNVLEFGRTILKNCNILFGFAIIEDFFHHTYSVTAVPPETLEEEEAKLLITAKRLIPRIPFEKIDLLIVQEIGKDISGSGMDPNITGRSGYMGISAPFAERIAVLDLTDKSHHNGAGIGLADVTTERVFQKIDFDQMYPNGITACDNSGMKLPPVMPNDNLAIRHAIHICTQVDDNIGLRAVWIKSTCDMHTFYISKALIQAAQQSASMHIQGCTEPIAFDKDGNAVMAW